ncbi:MAG: hypothetical protein WA746_23465, partial [Isosphaeraceae bacterium]
REKMNRHRIMPRRDFANWGGDGRVRPTARYSAATLACDFAQPTGNHGGIPGYRYTARFA